MSEIKKNSRTTNTIYNFVSSIGGQFLTIVMQFIVRTVFINTLGKSYLGISGLFSNILSMLSLAELGVGNAILFKLYKPLAEQDTKRINILLKFYKKVYILIGIMITILGICLIPFLKYMISDYDKLETLGINAIFIYLLYLFQSVSSYLFFAYKSAIVKADQKEYKLNVVTYLVTFIAAIVQIIILAVFKNFELYVIVLIISSISQNFINAHLAEKIYPYIKENVDEKIDKNEIKNILKDCAAIFLYKLNGVVLKATDNIVISTFLGLEAVGIYSNYYILYTTINTIFNKIFDSVTHSLGNLHTTDNLEHEYKVFKSSNLIAIILGATAGIGIFCVSNELIQAWIGEEWVLNQSFSLLMGFEIYTLATRIILSKYRNAMGLFQQAKYRPLVGMIINLIVSVLLVNKIGIEGVLIGTIVADWTTIMWYDPLIIYKYGFKNNFSIKKYYIKNIMYLLITAFMAIINYIICTNLFIGLGWMSVIIHIIICIVTVILFFIVLNLHTEEECYMFELGKKQILSIKNKLIKKSFLK